FDTTNIETDDGRNYTNGLRHRGLGKPGAHLGYERIDFGDGVSALSVGSKGQPAGRGDFDVVLEFRLDSPDGRRIGSIVLDEESGEQKVSLEEEVTGEHDVYVINATDGGWHFIHFDWFQFE
ncbi:MAG: carbohydrate-binding protein, partial [Planctomycetota bacterium]